MLRTLIHNWWLLALRGVFALFFAVLAFSVRTTALSWLVSPIAFASLVVAFGLFAFGAGIVTTGAALRGWDESHRERWLLLTDGVAASIAGILVVVLVPTLTLFHLITLIACWAVFIGICELMLALRLRRHISDEWALGLSSIVSIVFGVWLLLGKVETERSILLWLAAYSAVSAFTMLAFAFRLRNLQRLAHHAAA